MWNRGEDGPGGPMGPPFGGDRCAKTFLSNRDRGYFEQAQVLLFIMFPGLNKDGISLLGMEVRHRKEVVVVVHVGGAGVALITTLKEEDDLIVGIEDLALIKGHRNKASGLQGGSPIEISTAELALISTEVLIGISKEALIGISKEALIRFRKRP